MKTLRTLGILAAVVAAASFALAQAGKDAGTKSGGASDAKTRVEVVGVSVARPVADAPINQSAALNLPAGVWLHLSLSRPDKVMFALDARQQFAITSLTDDKQTALLTADSKDLAYGVNFADDGRSLTVALGCPRAPAAGATQIKLKGTANVLCGTGPRKAQTPAIQLKPGAEFALGPAKMKVEQLAAEGAGLSIVLSGDEPFSQMKSLTLAGPDGKDLETRPAGSQAAMLDGQLRIVARYILPTRLDRAIVKADYFDRVEKLSVPLDVTVSLGL